MFKPWPGKFCCVLGQDTTHSVLLSTQVYKWVQANLILEVPCNRLASHLVGNRNTPRTLLHATETRETHRPDRPLGLYADFVNS